ncbi:MAG: hypothetical protein JWQ76_2034 [Ramlibacter sp.]|nr:hypothetical protein [Ramlibacter sp.]
MTHWLSAGPTVLASFLASTVEFVEALTIVLAVGLTRGWRSTLLGTAAGIAVLAVLVIALGSSLPAVPLALLQLVVGVLLLMFGLRWLHKSILRAAGTVPLRDEAQAFSRETQAMRASSRPAAAAVDAIAFMTTFKTVLLEGLEVVFVVVALGVKGGLLLPASAGALLALLLVAALGLFLHRPLAKVPENTLKFAVGIMLTAFGTYWAGEGIGLAWPAQDASILLLIGVFLGLGLLLVKACGWLREAQPARPAAPGKAAVKQAGALAAVGGELLGLFVEDLWLAAGIAVWVAGAALVEARQPPAAGFACLLFTAGMAAILSASAVRRTRARS